MLNFYHGTQLEKLADQLLRELDQHPAKNLLAPEIFVVQNHGIGQWLSLYMAEQEGIAANLKFEFPSERIWSLIRMMDPDIPQTLPSDRGPMTWTLMQLLGDEQVLSGFPSLRYYVQDEDPNQRAVRSWKLSSKIADVFDQYLVYRPDLLLDWEQDILRFDREAERWQARLWRRLIGYWEQHYDGKWLHRAQLQQELLKHLKEGSLDTDQLPERVSVFGVSTLPPISVEILVALSEIIDVNFYQLSVNPEVEDSEAFKNPLLQSLGKEGTKFMSVFSDYAEPGFKSVDTFEPSPEPSAFKEIQRDLKEDAASSGSRLNIPVADASIQVHSCHGPMREVEVLYDQLLALLDENPELNPDDILIMTPDIEAYAPMIEAVFEMPDEGQPEIPYSIADRGVQGASPAVRCFLKILELSESRFKVTDVLDLLDANPIQEAFGFSDDDLNRLETWIRDNRIRWGIDGPFKKEMAVPQSDSFTWRSGLNRMLLGYAMKQDDDKLHDGIFPYEEIETSTDAELAGKFSNFLHALFTINKQVRNLQPTKKWADELGKVVDTFLPDNRDYFRAISTIRNAIDQLREFAALGNFDGAIPFRIVRSLLKETLVEQSTGGGRIGRGVTFSSLKPMRSIPFKVIGMIGMNEGAFPQSKIPIEFDLMNLELQPGDPIRLEEDRYLFLENLLSARSHLYFSYVGQSNREDSDFPPSVVLREFMDYLKEYYGLKTKDILTKHRLQAFSPAYFKKNELFSYSQTQKKVAEELTEDHSATSNFMRKNLPLPDEEWKRLSVNNLISFFQHPAKYLFQNRLGIYLREDDVLTEDREPFEMNGLDGYWVGQELLDRFMKEKPLNSYQQILESRNMLPEGWSGEQAYRQKAKEVRAFGSEISTVLNQQPLDDCEVDLEIDDFRIVGNLSQIYEDALISYRFGSMRPKDLIDLWIRHLLFQLVKPFSHEGNSILFTRDKKKPFARYQLSPLKNAREILRQLLTFYWDGLQQAVYLFPESSFAYSEEVIYKGKDLRSGLYKASRKWVRDYGNYNGESADPYNKLLLGARNPLQTEKFQQQAAQFWTPFFNVLNQTESK